MKQLGWGTGVSVYCLSRNSKSSSTSDSVDSPTKTPSTKRSRSRLDALRSPAMKLPPASPWAVKKANKKAPPVIVERLKEEAELLRTLQHPNIIGFRQVSTTSDGRLALAMELGGDSSLYDRIEARSEAGETGSFKPLHIFRVGVFIARALAYLHDERRLLHGDIKSANVLVSGDDFCKVKLCDFGVCQRIDENLEMIVDVGGEDGVGEEAEYVGTEPWCAKEVFEGGVISNKTDVFSFGLTLWEMWTLKVPHLDYDDDKDDENDDDVIRIDDSDDEEGEVSMDSEKRNPKFGTRPPVPEEILESEEHAHLVDIFLVCSMEDSRKRPSAAAVVKAFENVQTSFIETPSGSPLFVERR